MADRTEIPLTEATWNPVTGCTPASPGCRRCYARRFALRLAGRYGYPESDPFAVTVHPERMGQPAQWKKPRHVFVCSMGDIFHDAVPEAARRQVFAAMAEAPQHTYMILTKRALPMALWLGGEGWEFAGSLARNLWLGVSAENQTVADKRVPLLVASWSGPKLVCAEPLLDALDLSPWLGAPDEGGKVGWVVCGGETGPGGQQADPEHVRALLEQCRSAGTPFYFKSWGGSKPKRAGNLIDGEAWEQMP